MRGVAAVCFGLVVSCKGGDASGPRSCAPTTITVSEVGLSGVAELDFSCSGAGEPLEATVHFEGKTLLSLVAPQAGDARATGPRAAVVAPLGTRSGGAAGTIALAIDPKAHFVRGEVRANGPKLSGAFEGPYRLVCRVPSSVLNVQQRGVWMPGSESWADDADFATDFCTRFAALR